jgi:cell division protein FtsB
MRTEQSWLRVITKVSTFFVVGVVVLFLLCLGFGREYLRNREIERNIYDLQVQNDELSSKQLAALSVIQSLSSEYYLEGEGRTKHGLAKPGEEEIVIQQPELVANEIDDNRDEVLDAGNFVRWYYYFFNKQKFAEIRSL